MNEVTILADKRIKYMLYIYLGAVILIAAIFIYHLYAQYSTQKDYDAQIQEYQIKLDEKTKEASEWYHRVLDLENQLKNE